MADVTALLTVVARTAIVLIALFAGLRLLGRRRAGEGRVHEILLILLMANAVQNAMTSGSGRLSVALVSAGTLILAGWVVGIAFRRRPALQRRIGGAPTLLIHDGEIQRENLRAERLTHDEL